MLSLYPMHECNIHCAHFFSPPSSWQGLILWLSNCFSSKLQILQQVETPIAFTLVERNSITWIHYSKSGRVFWRCMFEFCDYIPHRSSTQWWTQRRVNRWSPCRIMTSLFPFTDREWRRRMLFSREPQSYRGTELDWPWTLRASGMVY